MDSYKERNRGHSRHYNNYQSDKIQEPSISQDSINGHKNNTSKPNSESPGSARSPTPFTFECLVCLNTYPTKKDLTNHLYKAQHLRPMKLGRYESNEDLATGSRKRKSNGFYCKMCHEDFSTYRELNIHINETGHFWSAKRAAREMAEHSSSSNARRKSREPSRRSSTSSDTRLDNSIGWQNQQGLFNTGESRGKTSTCSLSVQSSSGASDVILDDSLVMADKDIYILDDCISNFLNERDDSSKSSEKQTKELDSKLRMNNNQLDITSPDNSCLLQTKISVETCASESQKELTVIPMEPHVQAADPRQNFPCEKEVSGNNSKTLAAKWAPVYRDRPKPSVVEKQIPWKLIPIDLSPLNYLCTQPVLSNTSTHRVPSPAEDTLDASIDQLAAQLKENTGATFIPTSRIATAMCKEPSSLEENVVSCLNRDVISSNGTLISSSDDRASLQSSTPVLDENSNLEEPASNPEERPLLNRNENSLIENPIQSSLTSSVLPCVQLRENASTCKIGVTEKSLPTPFVIPSPCREENSETAAIKSEILSLSLALTNSTLVSQTSVPNDDCTIPQILLSNTQNVDPPSSSVVNGTPPPAVAIISASSPPIPSKQIDNVESHLSESPGEINMENVSVSCSTSCSSSPKPDEEEPIVVEEAVESCSDCGTDFNITRLKVDLKTGNVTISCLKCGRPTVMKHVFKKKR